MKKVFGLIVAVVVMICAVSTFGFSTANADALEDECDRIFFQTLNEIVADEGIVTTDNTVTKEVVYDLHLDPLGYIYYIYLEESDGFAIVVNTDGIYQINEIYLDAEDPYEGYEGQKIYINIMFYAVFDGENFYETSKGIKIDPEDEIFSENVLYASDEYGLTQGYEKIYYTNRVENKKALSKNHPAYTPLNLRNGCVPTAGANVIGFYTRFYPELVPGFEPGYYMGSYFIYDEVANEIIPVLATLADYMETNVGDPGTTVSGFKKGMTKFCNEKGRSISYNSCISWGKFSFDKAKEYFDNGQPSVMFVNTFTVAKLYNDTESEELSTISANAPHAMAGFGYDEITYTLIDGTTRKDNYIMVATGLFSFTKGYFNVNNVANVDDYYSINIY